MSGSFYCLDVLYCLPIIQAAQIGSIRSQRRSDSQIAALVGVITAVVWSIAEAAVVWPGYPLGALAMNIFTRSVTFTVLGRVLAKLWKERNFFRKDALTGLANRLEFDERFAAEQLRSEWSNRPYSLLLVEIEQFKKLNNNHNHQVVRSVLKAVSAILQDNSRCIDTVARISENKFGLLFPETDDYICGILGNRIRAASVKKFQAECWLISLSIGHVTVTGNAHSFDELLAQASNNAEQAGKLSTTQWNIYNPASLSPG